MNHVGCDAPSLINFRGCSPPRSLHLGEYVCSITSVRLNACILADVTINPAVNLGIKGTHDGRYPACRKCCCKAKATLATITACPTDTFLPENQHASIHALDHSMAAWIRS